MKRLRLVSSVAIALLLASIVRGQQPPSVLADRDQPGKMLYNRLLEQARALLQARKKAVLALKTPEQIRERQRRLRKAFIDAIGGFPAKTPLRARVVGTLERPEFRVEKVIYESRPNHHVTAAVYIPKRGKPPFPGVLVPCGHSANGKAAAAYQKVCMLLARNGFVVCCYDPIGQGERHQILDDKGKPAIPSSTSEHTMVGVPALLVGESAASYRIWDGIRSIDYLASRPDVDPKKIGCTGNSGGGTMTAYLMALDPRIYAAAPSCYITSLERLFSTIGPQDAEQNITGQVAFGMDHADYVNMRAPKPTLLLVATRDFFDIDGAWHTFRECKLLYGLLGYGERVSLFEYNDTHGFSKPRREAAVRWMRRWLLKQDDAIFEPELKTFSDAELRCTRTGEVLADLRGKSAFDFIRQKGRTLSQTRRTWLAKTDDKTLAAKVLALTGSRAVVQSPTAKELPEQKYLGCLVRRFRLETEPGIIVPVLKFVPRQRKPRAPCVVYVTDRGVAAEAKPGGPIESLVRKGVVVYAADLRGWGETSPQTRIRGLVAHFGKEWQEAFLGLHLNRPLLGQRADDLRSVLRWIRDTGDEAVQIVARGGAGPVALHAAFLSPTPKSVTLVESISSWDDVVGATITKNQLANAVPGVLAWYDLPDLMARLRARGVRVTITDPVDPLGRPIRSNK